MKHWKAFLNESFGDAFFVVGGFLSGPKIVGFAALLDSQPRDRDE
jgi:hypothetical protein